MITKGAALKGGMPLYKFVGNKVITSFQNFLLSTDFSEFHSGYRAYRVSSLKKIPFYLNSNDYPFDTEIIIQFVISKHKIVEIPIPTYYGFEFHAVHIKYAIQVCLVSLKAKIQEIGLIYDKKFDYGLENTYFNSSKENRDLESLLEKAKNESKKRT